MITSYRTAKVGKQTLKTSSVTPQKPNLDLEKCGLSEENKFEETEEPVSFRDNNIDENEQNVNLVWDSDSESHNDLKAQNKPFKLQQKSTPLKIQLKRLSQVYNKKAIMKMFNHIERELLYNWNYEEEKVIYLEDEEDRIWEIKKNDIISPRSLKALSSLKTLDSPLSIDNDDFLLNQNLKNKTSIVDFSKLKIEISPEESKLGIAKY